MMMILVTQTNAGTIVKHVPQEEMVGIRSYPPRELFSPLSWIWHNLQKQMCLVTENRHNDKLTLA